MSAARSSTKKKSSGRKVDAESMAKGQREISVSEFFAKNRHLLGFDNPRKALLTSIKEAVDNALDACEEAGILPSIFVRIEALAETRFRVTIRDNGPGIIKSQIANIFGKLLYGSKFHRLKMSRGQQGIGIAAAGMYGLMTTGKPMVIHTKPHAKKPGHRMVLAIDTQKNKADVSDETEHLEFEHDTGTEVQIELEAKYQRGKQSVDEYLQQTAIANPHAQFIYQPPSACGAASPQVETVEDGDAGDADPDELTPHELDDKPVDAISTPEVLIDDYEHAVKLAEEATTTTTTPGGTFVFPRTVHELPEEPKQIKPHPMGIELGTLIKMLKTTEHKKLGGFLQKEFCRVSQKVSDTLTSQAGVTGNTWVSSIDHPTAEKLYQAIQNTKFMSPPTDCLSPIGVKQILAGLLKGVKAEFYTATTRPPAVYRGNPFQIEVGMAYGGDLENEGLGRVIRFANRVPLLYQQSACCSFKAVVETNWRNYGLSQSRGALPQGPLVVMVHMASVWVPFTSESKEAIADYDDIRKEIRLAISECGRKLNTYVRRRQRMKRESQRRGVFERYIGEVVSAMARIDEKLDPDALREQFEAISQRVTEQADMQFDEDGNPIKVDRKKADTQGNGKLEHDDATVIVGEAHDAIDDDPPANAASKPKRPSRSDQTDDNQYELYE